MSKERMVQVTKDEYENLIRDQHTVELLTGYVQEQSWMIDSTICLLLGIQKSESKTVTADIPLPVPAMEEAEEEKQSPPPLSGAREEIGQKENRPWKSTGAASGRLVE